MSGRRPTGPGDAPPTARVARSSHQAAARRTTTIFPACYAGRWPHIHDEVYPSLADAATASNKLATSQLALTKQASAAVYASELYPQSTQNLSQVSLATDNVFSDGAELETPTITGSVADGYTIALTAAIAT